MLDKKLTDNEIKKALDVCGHTKGCTNCPLGKYDADNCQMVLTENTLDLINRRELKIKGLRRLLYSFLDTRNGDLVRITDNELEIIKKPIKAKAYKECIEKVENYIKTHCNPYGKPTFDYDTSIKILHFLDNLLKELVGEDK